MNRRKFFKGLGITSAAVIVAPKLLVETEKSRKKLSLTGTTVNRASDVSGWYTVYDANTEEVLKKGDYRRGDTIHLEAQEGFDGFRDVIVQVRQPGYKFIQMDTKLDNQTPSYIYPYTTIDPLYR